MSQKLTCFTYDAETGMSEFHRYSRDGYGLQQTHEGATDDPMAVAVECARMFPERWVPASFHIIHNDKVLAAQHKRYFQ